MQEVLAVICDAAAALTAPEQRAPWSATPLASALWPLPLEQAAALTVWLCPADGAPQRVLLLNAIPQESHGPVRVLACRADIRVADSAGVAVRAEAVPISSPEDGYELYVFLRAPLPALGHVALTAAVCVSTNNTFVLPALPPDCASRGPGTATLHLESSNFTVYLSEARGIQV
eukprot:gene5320-6464_t